MSDGGGGGGGGAGWGAGPGPELELLELLELEDVELVVLEAGALTWPPPTVTRTTRVTVRVRIGRSLVTTRGRRGRTCCCADWVWAAFSAASCAVLASAMPVIAPVAPATAQVARPVIAATANR